MITHLPPATQPAVAIDVFVPTRSPRTQTVTADPVSQEMRNALRQTMQEQIALAFSTSRELKDQLLQADALINGKMLREIPYLECTESSQRAIRALVRVLTLASIRPGLSPKAVDGLGSLSSGLTAQLHRSLIDQANVLASDSGIARCMAESTFAGVISIRDALLKAYALIKAIPHGTLQHLSLTRLTAELKAWSTVVNDSKRGSATLLPFGIDVSVLDGYSVPELQAARATAIEYKRYLGGQANPAFKLYWATLEAKLSAAAPLPRIVLRWE